MSEPQDADSGPVASTSKVQLPPQLMDEPAKAEESSDDEPESEGEPVVPLLAGRVRRENAGNRMSILIANEQPDLAEEDLIFAEENDDIEFITKEEKDVFDSDFEETSSEEGDDDENAGERALQKAEKEKKKVAQLRERGRALARKPLDKALHKPIRAPALAAAQAASAHLRPTKRRRLSPGGTRIIGGTAPGKRTSTRQTVVQFNEQVEWRLQADDDKRVRLRQLKDRRRVERERRGLVKRKRVLTQAELVAEALEVEVKNKEALNKFYAEQVAVDGAAGSKWGGTHHQVTGPRMTFLSRSEGERRPLVEIVEPDDESGEDLHARNYVIFEEMPRLTEPDTKLFLFGEHCDWSQPVEPAQSRQEGRQVVPCAITGRPARYLDPRTGVAYSDLESFKTIRRVIEHDCVWSDVLQSFVGSKQDHKRARDAHSAATRPKSGPKGKDNKAAANFDIEV